MKYLYIEEVNKKYPNGFFCYVTEADKEGVHCIFVKDDSGCTIDEGYFDKEEHTFKEITREEVVLYLNGGMIEREKRKLDAEFEFSHQTLLFELDQKRMEKLFNEK